MDWKSISACSTDVIAVLTCKKIDRSDDLMHMTRGNTTKLKQLRYNLMKDSVKDCGFLERVNALQPPL